MLYLDSGYLNFDYIFSAGTPFNFVIGGRGIGKTYGAIKWCLDNNKCVMLMRRTQTQADIVATDDLSPFTPFECVIGADITTRNLTKGCAGVYRSDNPEMPFAYITALSTISNLRGFDASRVEVIIYDEFIPERHERTLRDEGAAFLNAYETINRNRELNGKPPIMVFALANSNRLDNPIFNELRLVPVVDKMLKKGREEYHDRQRGLSVYSIQQSPISDRKKDTALYKLGNKSYNDMALSNDFGFDRSNISSRNLSEYNPICTIRGITICRHKHRQELFVTAHFYGSPEQFDDTDSGVLACKRKYGWVWIEHLEGRVYYESANVKVVFLSIF